MPEADRPNQQQAALWNDAAGNAWVQMQQVLDGMLAPFTTLLLDHCRSGGEPHLDRGDRTDISGVPRRVLDIGCGAGATTLAVAQELGRHSECVGADISAPLIAVARRRALEVGLGSLKFVQADAQTHNFEPDGFDCVISRFGVMFFDDPPAAFANLRRATRQGGKLAFVAWRGPADNPFMTAAVRAAAPLLPSLPVPDPDQPGQFGLADPARIQRILHTSGWSRIQIQPLDVPTQIAANDIQTYITQLGPVGLALQTVDEPTRARTTAALRAAFDPFIQGAAAHFIAASWLVTAFNDNEPVSSP